MDRMALGQGGLSDQPMWADRIPEIRALRPRLIRLFVQEYFNLLPESGGYHFDSLDRSVETILRAGATPLTIPNAVSNPSRLHKALIRFPVYPCIPNLNYSQRKG